MRTEPEAPPGGGRGGAAEGADLVSRARPAGAASSHGILTLRRGTPRLAWLFGRSRSDAGRGYLLPMAVILSMVASLFTFEILRAPLPPGVDPAHWLSIAYPYVGLPTAPEPANRPGVYSPLLFPMLGGLVRLTGNPATAADAMATLLLIGYGLTVIHLARRYLSSGMVQVAFAGTALFTGTTLQMLFWGAYPNYLGFICLNETMVFLLLWTRERRTRDAAAFFGAATLTFFAHDLTFTVLLGILFASGLFLLAFRRIPIRFLVDRRNLLGATGVVASIGAYLGVTAALGIPHPSYFYSNPSAYTVDEIGELFIPLGHYPAVVPGGPTVILPPLVAVALLLLGVAAVLFGLFVINRLYPARLNTRAILAGAWLSAAALAPAAGWLAHVDTDYERFLYFLPLPFYLLVFTLLDRGLSGVRDPWWTRAGLVAPNARFGGGWDGWGLSGPRPRKVPVWLPGATIAVVLLLLFTTVTIPVAQSGETTGAGAGHDANFVAAAAWINGAPPGNVLTMSTVSRWVEALTNRNVFTNGPVWLLFDPFQILQTEESYWALTSQYALASGPTVLAYSGFASTEFAQAPLYTAYDQGIPFPMFRVVPTSLSINATCLLGSGTYPLMGGPPPELLVPGPDGTSGVVIYTNSAATVTESATPLPNGNASLSFHIAPRNGCSVDSLLLVLAPPSGTSPLLARDKLLGATYRNGRLDWTVSGSLGQYPYPVELTTTVMLPDPPSFQTYGRHSGILEWQAVFPDPSGSSAYTLPLTVSTAGANNEVANLPAVFDTKAFLSNESIHYLLWPSGAYYAHELAYYEATFGFQPAYNNSEWTVLQS